jgi:tetratricopeptide (TPR) repeat protein
MTASRPLAFRPRLSPRQALLLQWALAAAVAAACAWPMLVRQRADWSEQFRETCRKLTETEDWGQLETTARQWTEWEPGSGDPWLYLAEAVRQQGDLEATNRHLAQIPDSYPRVQAALELQGDLLFSELNRPLEAHAVWQRMVRLDPNSSAAYQRLTYYYALTQQRERLLDTIQQALAHGADRPEFYVYWMLADALQFSDGMFQTTKWLQGAPEDEALQVAQAFYYAKRSETGSIPLFGTRAIDTGRTARMAEFLDRYPQNLRVLSFFIEKAIHEGDADRVAELLEAPPPAAERDNRFWRYRAWYLASTDSLDDAEAAARQSLALYPPGWRTWLELSHILRRNQQTSESEQAAETARIGKELERKLLTLPNAADVDESTAREMLAFARRAGDREFVGALSRRMSR